MPKLSEIRKALIAAVPPLLPILAYFLGVLPQAHELLGPLVYVAILGELGAAGVYAVTNARPDAPLQSTRNAAFAAEPLNAVPTALVEKEDPFVGAADQVVPPPA